MPDRFKAVRVVIVQAEEGSVVLDPAARDVCWVAGVWSRQDAVEPRDHARSPGLRVDVDDRLAAELLAQALRGRTHSGGRGDRCGPRARVEEGERGTGCLFAAAPRRSCSAG